MLMNFYTESKLSDNISTTPEGYLVCMNVAIARTGEQVYDRGELPGVEAGPDGKIIIMREAAEVFRPETIASFQGKSLTLWHPEEFVEPKNWTVHTKGIVTNVRRGEGANANDLLADIMVTDARAIELIKGGLREVSCGYEAEYVQTGIGRAVQKNIVGNHLAMVDEGRAGAAYAINDHKGKGSPMTLIEKIKAHFAKSEAETLKLITEDGKPAEEKKAATLDDVLAAIQKIGTKDMVDAGAPPVAPGVEEKSADEPLSVEERLAKLEAMVAKIMEGMSAKASDEEKPEEEKEVSDEESESDEVVDEEVEVSEDEESCDEEKKDDDKEKTGDMKSRVEILAPGMTADGKDVKRKALIACYQTTDGKAIIEQFTDGKTPDFKNDSFVDATFVAASEVLKLKRSSSLAHTKTFDFAKSTLTTPKGGVSADDLNKKNAEFYKNA